MEPYLKNSMKKDDKGYSKIEYLSACENGVELTVIGVDAGFRAKTRLANLGLVPGVKIIKKKSAPWKGPIEIIVKGTSLVIGRGLASRVLVKHEESCEL